MRYARLKPKVFHKLAVVVDIKTNSQQSGKSSVNLDSLQQEVITLLDEINLLIADTKADLNDSTELQYDRFQAQISAMGQNVANLELRMAIVAPMKAGKSTIINAIAGQELLPSCAVAMTTLPTEIVFNSQQDRPTLYLSQNTISLFQQLERQLKQQIDRLGIEPLQQRLARYPHLLDLFAKVATESNFSLTESISGQDAITRVLNRLNHLIRIYSVIEPTQDPLSLLKDIPRIETPSLSLANQKQTEGMGNLTIVDTPGPNEAGDGLKLTAVVEEQLRRSSIVLIVLDFTQLNSEAAEVIKRQIQPIVESIGKDNLYVLVNKIDQRRQGDMTPEQVKEFVMADLDLEPDRHGNRVFEVAAVRAFTATKFLLEVQQNPQIQLLEIKSLTALAQEVLGIDWDEELDDITVKILVKKARKLWQRSGFAAFFASAIAVLMENAAPQCLTNALNLSRTNLLAIRDDLNLRYRAISQDTAKIQQEIKSLEADLTHIESCRERLSSMAEIKIKLQQNLQIVLQQLKTEAAFDVENFFVEEEYLQADALKKADINARNLLLSNLSDFELFPKWVSENLKAGIEYKTAGIVSFKTEAEAEYFTQEAVTKAKQRLENLILQVSQDIEQEIARAKENLEKFLVEETADIIERAKNRLQTAFKIQLDLPSPIVPYRRDLTVEKQLVKTKSRLVDDGYEERLVRKRAWYYWFGMVPFYKQEQFKKPYKQENYYTVSVHEIVKQINSASDMFIDEIENEITIYLEGELQQQVDNFFVKLDRYLSNYLQSLQQAQFDRQLGLDRRETLSHSLSKLVPKASDYIKRTDSYLSKTRQMLTK